MALLGQLSVNLIAQTKDFNKGFDKAEKRVKKFGKTTSKMSSAVAGMTSAVQGLLGAATALAAFEGFRQAAEYAKELNQQSELLGVSTLKLQVYARAAAKAGMQVEQLTDSIRDIRQRTGEAIFDPNSEPAEAFGRLGLDPHVLQNSTNILGDLQRAISNVGDTSERIDIMDQLLGDQGPQLLRAFTADFDSLQQKMTESGQFISKEALDKLEVVASRFGEIAASAKAIGVNLAATFTEPMNAVLDRLALTMRFIKEEADRIMNNPLFKQVMKGVKAFAGAGGIWDVDQKVHGTYHGPANLPPPPGSGPITQDGTGVAHGFPRSYMETLAHDAWKAGEPESRRQEMIDEHRRYIQSYQQLEREAFAIEWDQDN